MGRDEIICRRADAGIDGVHRVWKLNAYNCNVMGVICGDCGRWNRVAGLVFKPLML